MVLEGVYAYAAAELYKRPITNNLLYDDEEETERE
jgi:hypothetical protein